MKSGGRTIRSQTKPKHWKGGKIHAAVTSDGIPVAVACTFASLHDSQVMIPLVRKASERMEHGFDLADAAYDSETIREVSAEEGNVPVIDANGRRGERRHMTDTEREIFRDRSTDERFFRDGAVARLRDARFPVREEHSGGRPLCGRIGMSGMILLAAALSAGLPKLELWE